MIGYASRVVVSLERQALVLVFALLAVACCSCLSLEEMIFNSEVVFDTTST